jgi:3'-phosphoadenosine 5'-phosphosulfate sulfotransferase (PAPS reductase)/FAD synthetase
MDHSTVHGDDLALDAPPSTPLLDTYEHVLVFFSGGKDSIACVIALLEQGVEPAKIELHHHLVDGRSPNPLFDWPVTEDYCRKFAQTFGMPIYFSWKDGGMEREMLRDEAPTAPISITLPDGRVVGSLTSQNSPKGTRLKFPQVSADLRVRWCSSYLKIGVGDRVITGQERFEGKRTLVVTGERAAESKARATYRTFEAHRTHRDGRVKRHVDHWRPVHAWSDEQVWDALRRWRVNPHPAYWLGFGRCSCMTCIFGGPHQWATVRDLDPQRFERIAQYEKQFGVTIARDESVIDLANRGSAYAMAEAKQKLALGDSFDEPILLLDEWTLPPGAFADSTGPT